MRNDFYTNVMIVFCAVAGCLAGYGIDFLLENGQVQEENAKDNTLLREEYDGVFFDEEQVTPTLLPTILPTPDLLPEPTKTEPSEEMPVPTAAELGGSEESLTPTPVPGAEPTLVPIPTQVPTPGVTPVQVLTPSVTPTQVPVPSMTPKVTPTELPLTATVAPQEAEVITYPAEIFGQVPVVNRSDTYVTYFEFAIDLIETLEAEIRQKNLNETVLFTKFMLKALFCGIDVKSVKINNPIPRSQAALAMHLAAQIMEEKGTGTTAKSAAKYVTDISDCSSSEKKAIAYLYEQGMVQGYQISGQRFYPENSLKETDEAEWMARAKQRWK